MPAIQITSKQKDEFNTVASHPLQSFEWGGFREKTGVKVIRRGIEIPDKSQNKNILVDGFQLTIHKIPHTPFTIGYLPKGNIPTKEIIGELKKIGKEEKCIFIQLEPNIVKNHESGITNQEKNDLKNFELIIHDSKFMIQSSAHPLFTKYTFILDITKSEEELLKNMSSKTRYNIRLAERKGVKVKEDDSEKAFKRYLELTQETTKRQKFYAHTNRYHTLMWETLRSSVFNGKLSASGQSASQSFRQKNRKTDSLKDSGQKTENNNLTAHLLTAVLENKILVTWIVFVFQDTLYYPYGASSSKYRETMASNLIMWETIRFGKQLGLKKFDMWGALSDNPDPKDPWFGFHRFKSGYGPEHIEFVGSYDLIINPAFYQMYKIADKLRWILLRLKK